MLATFSADMYHCQFSELYFSNLATHFYSLLCSRALYINCKEVRVPQNEIHSACILLLRTGYIGYNSAKPFDQVTRLERAFWSPEQFYTLSLQGARNNTDTSQLIVNV